MKEALLESAFPFIIIFFVFFMLVLRPQQKRAQEQKKFRDSLKKGDSVLTTGGILGTIEGLTDHVATLQIANGVKIKVLRSAIAGEDLILSHFLASRFLRGPPVVSS